MPHSPIDYDRRTIVSIVMIDGIDLTLHFQLLMSLITHFDTNGGLIDERLIVIDGCLFHLVGGRAFISWLNLDCRWGWGKCPPSVILWLDSVHRVLGIEAHAFSTFSVRSMVIPRTVELLGRSCFSRCESLSSVSFESDSKLKRIGSDAFSWSSLKSIVFSRVLHLLTVRF
jgi:hypothetical protein